jgi:mannose-6-phosphate isomerase-like protein (cupin superfamily)
LRELYRWIDRYFSHSDGRGSIEGILNVGIWREVNLIKSGAGIVRGGHYHEQSEECFFILKGKIKVELRLPQEGMETLTEILNVKSGDVFIVPAMVEHTFNILEDAEWINMMSVPVDQSSPDFHKYD